MVWEWTPVPETVEVLAAFGDHCQSVVSAVPTAALGLGEQPYFTPRMGLGCCSWLPPLQAYLPNRSLGPVNSLTLQTNSLSAWIRTHFCYLPARILTEEKPWIRENYQPKTEITVQWREQGFWIDQTPRLPLLQGRWLTLRLYKGQPRLSHQWVISQIHDCLLYPLCQSGIISIRMWRFRPKDFNPHGQTSF